MTQKIEQIEEVINEATGKICLSPCQIACPIREPIQRTNAMLSLLPLDKEEAYPLIIKIGDEIYDKNPLFTICSYICGLCEKECNYKDQTGAIRRRMLKRFLADYYLPYLKTKSPLPPPTKEKVAVIGGGPGGLMCAYMLSKTGYKVTILERESELGGALRYIPQYRLPTNIMDATLNNLVRIAHVEVKFGIQIGNDGKTLDDLKKEGYQAIFIATGTPLPRPLAIERKPVPGADLSGVGMGLYFLFELNRSKFSCESLRHSFTGKKVIVIGGGNVAFDAARSARRLNAEVSIVCLENADKSSKDGIPADVEEIEGATEERIKINYSRGVEEIVGENGKFRRIKCPKCTQVWGGKGRFNPKFDYTNVIYLEGDMLLITIGQAPERTLFDQEGLLDEKGRLDVDPLSLMSTRREGIFIGGDVRRVGFAADAMRDGMVAAESIHRYLRGEDLRAGMEKEYEEAPPPKLIEYKPQPKIKWVPPKERLNFELFEKSFTIEEVAKEARRCFCCGPCRGCKGCVALELQPEIPEIEINQDICGGCGICGAVCNYEATRLEETNGRLISVIDELKCKRCGSCVVACPAKAAVIKDGLMRTLPNILAERPTS